MAQVCNLCHKTHNLKKMADYYEKEKSKHKGHEVLHKGIQRRYLTLIKTKWRKFVTCDINPKIAQVKPYGASL